MSTQIKRPSRKTFVGLLLTGLLLVFLLSLTVPAAHASSVLYAGPTVIGSGNCSSWENACTLQTALAVSLSGDEIWVKAGMHKPTPVASDRAAHFQLKSGVALYGGFAGAEITRDQRDWTANITVLSGDIDGNDTTDPAGVVTTTTAITGTNSYHVVIGNYLVDNPVLDGFTITAGLANLGDYEDSKGGGLFNSYGSLTLANMIFSGNQAKNDGGGMGNFNCSSLVLTNVTFLGNQAGFDGGGLYSNACQAMQVTNATFTDNAAVNDGGGMKNYASAPVMINIIFRNNSARYGGGLFNGFNELGSPTLINIVFSGNQARHGGGMYEYYYSSPTLTNVVFWGNRASENGGGMYNWNHSSPSLTHVTFAGNHSGLDGVVLFNGDASNPLLQNGVIGNNQSQPTDTVIFNDETSNTLIRSSLVQGCNPGGVWQLACGTDGGNNLADANPYFVDVAGGDLHLRPGSAAIDAGNNAYVSVTTDLAGGPRLVDIPAAPDSGMGTPPLVDMGAYEANFAAATQGGTGQFIPHPITPNFGTGDSTDITLGDIDNDGDLDALVVNHTGVAETVWLNDGTGSFTPHPTTPSFGAGNSQELALGDIDGDDDLDAIVANDTNQSETVWLNDGLGNFTAHPTTPAFGSADSTAVELHDLDGDGDLDALVANFSNQAETVWLNDGAGNFTPHPTTPSFGMGNSQDMGVGDLDDDGDMDVIIANTTPQAETVWLNDGAGNFIPHPTTPSFEAGQASGMAIGNIDRDGDLDVVFAMGVTSGDPETVWLNDGAGNFAPQPTSPSFGTGTSRALPLGDIDGDGDLDLLVTNAVAEAETVWFNNGSGSFTAHPVAPAFGSGNSSGMAMGDIDGDGDLDALVANVNGEAETVWINQNYVSICGLVGGNTYTFSPTSVQIEIATLGSLSCLQVQPLYSNHPDATAGIQTGQYWIITPIGNGYTVNLTLPVTVADVNDKVCRYTSSGNNWDCVYSSHTDNTVTRNGVTQLSAWAVGNNVGPTTITLHNLATQTPDQAEFVGVIVVVVMIVGSFIIFRRNLHQRS